MPVWILVPMQGLAPAAALALVLLAAGGSLARAEAGPVQEAVEAGIPFTAVLRVSGEPSSLPAGAFGGDRYLVDADVIGGVLRGRSFASTTPVVVIGSDEWAGMGTGDIVRVLGTARPSDRVGRATAVFLPSSRPRTEEAEGWLGYTDGLRTRFRQLSLRDGRDGGLLPGMAIGDRTGLDPGLGTAMKATGLTHLTAVSGANCSYAVAFAFLGLRLARVPRFPAAIGAVGALVAFVMLVRPEPSVLRAAVMGGIGVVAVLSGRGRVSLTLLMLSIIVLLAADPWLSVSFAFMLSVAATFGLVTAGPMVVGMFGRVLPRFVAQVLAIPLTAQLFCTPILVLIQPALPLYSLPANVLASPVVPAVTLLGMAAILALVVVPAAALPLIGAAQWGTRWVAGLADALADAPGAALPWPSGALGAVLAVLASLALLVLIRKADLLTVPRRRRPRAGADRPAANRTTVIAAVVAVTLGIATVVVAHPAAPRPEEWDLTLCDVGQGDGLVLRTTPGHALVVDVGPDADAMDRCLDTLQIEVIDALVITHLHEDHYGGIEGAVRGRTLTALYYSTGEDGLAREVAGAASDSGVDAVRLDRGMSLDVAPLRVDVLWPARDDVPTEENNASAVLEVVVPSPGRPVSILLTGDLEEDAAAALLAASPALVGGIDIIKVAHHGARNGGTALIGSIRPRLALISVGQGNDYGHPHPTIIEALDRDGIAIARTDELGSFVVDVLGTTVEVRSLE